METLLIKINIWDKFKCASDRDQSSLFGIYIFNTSAGVQFYSAAIL